MELAVLEAVVADVNLIEHDVFVIGDILAHRGAAEPREAVILTLRGWDLGDVGEEAGGGLLPVFIPQCGIFGVCQVDEFLSEFDCHGCSGSGLWLYYGGV